MFTSGLQLLPHQASMCAHALTMICVSSRALVRVGTASMRLICTCSFTCACEAVLMRAVFERSPVTSCLGLSTTHAMQGGHSSSTGNAPLHVPWESECPQCPAAAWLHLPYLQVRSNDLDVACQNETSHKSHHRSVADSPNALCLD